MSKFQNALGSAAPATAKAGDALEWENVQMDTLSPALQAKFVAMLDARKAFEDAMIAAAGKAKLIDVKTETLLFGYKFLTRGQVSVAPAPIKRQVKAKSRFAL